MKTAVFTFGRMNPPTVGHEKLVNKVRKVSKIVKGTPYVFLSKTSDKKKNPLLYRDKLKYAKKSFGNIVQDHKGRNIFDLMKELEKRFDSVNMVVGSDRVSEFESLLNKYNGKEYDFDSITITSAGERDPDEEGVRGMSASKMRKAAADDDFESFKNGLPSLLKRDAKKVYDNIRKNI